MSESEQQQSNIDRQEMVDTQIMGRGIVNARLLDVMRQLPREQFVPPDSRNRAHRDAPLPIGHDQTISQPYIVALMTELVDPRPTDVALEIGTGCGYQAAILAELVSKVYTIEVVPALAREAEERLERLGYTNIVTRLGDGYGGWPEAAPFNIILLAAAPPEIPRQLVEQLAPGGRMILPVGATSDQRLKLITKDAAGKVSQRDVASVAFVPMVEGRGD